MASTVQSIAFNANKQLTTHVNSNELNCKCGEKHNTIYCMDTLNKIEEIMKIIGATKVIFSSGYRCSKHDKNVGGNGNGPHTGGFAVDCCFYKGNSTISTKIISCIAQDLGFRGIANINSSYTYIHLDMKDRNYKGNEIVNNNTVTSDFYGYYKLSKTDVYGNETVVDTPSVITEQKQFNIGDIVQVNSGSKDYNGRSLASFVYNSTFKVMEVSGNRVVIGDGKNVTAAMNSSCLTKSASSSAASATKTISVGSTVRVKSGSKTYTNGSLASFVYKTNYKVMQISGNRIVIGDGKTVTAAINAKDLELV